MRKKTQPPLRMEPSPPPLPNANHPLAILIRTPKCHLWPVGHAFRIAVGSLYDGILSACLAARNGTAILSFMKKSELTTLSETTWDTLNISAPYEVVTNGLYMMSLIILIWCCWIIQDVILQATGFSRLNINEDQGKRIRITILGHIGER